MFRESPLPNTRSPAAPASSELRYSPNVFCDTCQRNQELVRQILSEYLPDEDENEYAFRVGRLDEYEQSVRRRYPVVCRSCQSKVDERLQRQAQWMCRKELASALKRSDNEYSDIEPLPDLDVLSMGTRSRKGSVRQDVEKMDVDLASALSGNSRPKPSAADAGKAIDYRPFQTARFSAAPSTGLEAKMTSFSIDDDDDDSIIGSHGFLSSPAADRSLPHLIQSTGPLNVILTAGVICTWLVAERIPTWLFWLLRFVLIAKLVCKAAHLAAQKKAHTPRAARATRPVSTGKGSLQPWVLVCTAVLVCLAAAPGIYTLGLVPAAAASSHSQGWSLLRWPLARRAMSHAILNTDLGDTTVEAAASALLGLDLAAELASLFV
ncbi:hypothetical protein GGI12_003976 [Dipsacomyces acuminosporus]|nr:hypothetical protein GGI12_003976 [Dipsacomyces acuminosporus]